ncbi:MULTISPECIES: FUSC family protein [Streptomyces]|uniref:FUSC family protein n=1 Tax=Streptomyces lycopersici TaxID=2974589 RepID=UPI0021CE2FD5|nr:FUSC family protein [Streptomyces sp. NEAU-383]
MEPKWRERILTFDPGLIRTATGIRSFIAMGAAAGWEYVFARAVGWPVSPLPMYLAGFMAMISIFAVLEVAPARRVVSTLSLSLAMVIGLALGSLTATHRTFSLVLYVFVTVTAVWVRRFGPRLLGCGMTGWMGYLCAALFAHVPPAALATLVPMLVTAAAWLAVLNVTILRELPSRQLALLIRALRAQALISVRAAAALYESGQRGNKQLRRRHRRAHRTANRLTRSLARLNDTALVIDGHLVMPGAAAPQIRARVLDLELSVASLARTAHRLSTVPSAEEPPASLDSAAIAETRPERLLMRALSAGDVSAAAAWAERVLARPVLSVIAPVRSLAAQTLRFVATERALADAPRTTAGAKTAGETPSAAAVALVGGNLPGTAATAAAIAAEHASRPLRFFYRLRLTTRQAIQAGIASALALLVGYAIDQHYFFWAAACCLVVFNGTATGEETVTRSIHRTAGTALGLLPAIAVAGVAGVNPVMTTIIILAVISLGIGLIQFSYAITIFCLTVALGPLYGAFGAFSNHLMMLRFAETATGTVISSVVVLTVLPTRTPAATHAARRAMFHAVGDLLDTAAALVRGRAGFDTSLHVHARVVDAARRQIQALTRPPNVPVVLPVSRTGTRRLVHYGALAMHVRSLARSAQAPSDAALAETLGRACEILRDLARVLAEPTGAANDVRQKTEAVDALLAEATARTHGMAPDPDGTHAAIEHLTKVRESLDLLAGASSGATRAGGGIKASILSPAVSIPTADHSLPEATTCRSSA